jgi:glycosyltransferase involved in cell wall biosynthesis
VDPNFDSTGLRHDSEAAWRAAIADTDPERYQLLSPPTDVYRKTLDAHTREVIVESEVGPQDYESLAEQLGPWAVRDMDYLKRTVGRLNGLRVEEANPTANGGGVQMILTDQVNLLSKLGLDIHWRLMYPDPKTFLETKKWHNTTQAVANPTLEEIEAGFPTYEQWIDMNYWLIGEHLNQADIVTIHDPQPHGLIPYIDKPVVWRSHIQNRTDLIATPGSPQERIWDYLWSGKVDQARAHVFHPVDEFVPHNVPAESVLHAPATFDPFDDLNRLNLTGAEKQKGRDFIDEQLETSFMRKLAEAPAEDDWSQSRVDWERPIMSLIARFDPSKGMPPTLIAYAEARDRMVALGILKEEIPQLVMIGNGSVDDPDGEPELIKMMGLRARLDGDLKDDVKIIRVPHNDMAINTLMHEADFGLQPSLAEGFETRASDWIWHGKPVIVSNRGGLPLQVYEGKSGFVVDPDNTDLLAQRMFELSTNTAQYNEMARWAEYLGKTYNYREFSTVANAIRWVEIYSAVLEGRPHYGRRWRISEIVDGEVPPETVNFSRKLGSTSLRNNR